MNKVEMFVFLSLKGRAYKTKNYSSRAIGSLTLIHSLCCIHIDLKDVKREYKFMGTFWIKFCIHLLNEIYRVLNH